jgi:SAM-dependent methyltransferase
MTKVANNSSRMALSVKLLPLCPCCENSIEAFLPIPQAYVRECEARGVEHPLDGWETLNLEAYLCPVCGATDRDRLQVLFLQEFFAQRRKDSRSQRVNVLEIAPNTPVAKWLQFQSDVEYRSCDLHMPHVDDRVDVADMACYANARFDVVICSHVLEHVPEDLKAMRELRRVLATDGVALLLVPISMLNKGVDEAPDVSDEAERWRRFGQGDHVRIYSREPFEARLTRAGFKVSRFTPAGNPFGLTPTSTLYIGR